MAGIGSAPGIILGVGVGTAAGAALAPAIEVPKQQAWAGAPNRILDVGLLARLVAQGGIDLSHAHDEAKLDGYGPDRLDALVYLEQVAPGSGEALALWRLGLLGTADDPSGDVLFQHALTKAGLDPRFAAAIIARKTAERLGLGDVAYGVVRGILPAPSWVPVAPPTTTTNVKRFPVVNIDPVKLAAALGYDEDMLKLMVGRSGLSMAPGLAAQAHFRKILEADDYLLAVAEGDLRTEWGAALLEVSRQILNPHEYAEAELRGVKTHLEAKDGAAQHGMIEGDYDTLFAIMGRPIAEHQVTTGLARGGTYGGTYEDVPEGPYRDSIRRSAIRPEYARLAYANRYTYPSAFVLRSLAEAGDLGDADAVAKILEEIGWKPTLAAQVAAKWMPAGAAVDPHVKKAQTTLFTEAHKAYVKNGVSVAQVTPAFTALNIPADAQLEIVALWDVERTLAADVPPPA